MNGKEIEKRYEEAIRKYEEKMGHRACPGRASNSGYGRFHFAISPSSAVSILADGERNILDGGEYETVTVERFGYRSPYLETFVEILGKELKAEETMT